MCTYHKTKAPNNMPYFSPFGEVQLFLVAFEKEDFTQRIFETFLLPSAIGNTKSERNIVTKSDFFWNAFDYMRTTIII